jgi:Domain of unknown function (DUF4129)
MTKFKVQNSKFKISRFLTTIAWLMLFVVFSTAATVSEYRKSVANAIYELDTIYNLDDENLSVNEQKSEIQTSLQNIRNDLLKVSKVEIDGVSLEIDNAWLKEKLAAIENTKDHEELLDQAVDELTTLQQKLDEVEKQTLGDRTKNQDKLKLQEILSRNEYQRAIIKEKAEAEKTWFQKWWESVLKAFDEWWKSMFPENPDIPTPSSESLGSLSIFLQVLIVGLALGIVGFVIYKFAPLLFGIKRKEKKERKSRVILGETISADQDSADILSDADLLAQKGDLRGAIRKGYIALLCELNDRKIIGLAQHKTNRDYLRDVRKDKPLHQNMDVLTTSFERHWYGFSNANEQDWQEFRAKYRETVGRK